MQWTKQLLSGSVHVEGITTAHIVQDIAMFYVQIMRSSYSYYCSHLTCYH